MDVIDQAQAREDQVAELIERQAREARAAELSQQGSEICADCHDEIPLERRRAMPSAIRCIGCQEFAERLGRAIKNKNGGTP